MPERVRLRGSLKRQLPKGVIRAEAPAGEFTVNVLVRPKNKKPSPDEQARLKPRDRQYLSRAEHAQMYGASPEDLKKVENFATSHGLRVVSSNAETRTVVLSGTAAAYAQAFGVQLVTCIVGSRAYRCRQDAIYIPTELDGVITGVFGLDNRQFARPHYRVKRASMARPASTGAQAAAAVAPAPAVVPGFTPVEIAKLYNFPTPADGTGQTIAILELGGGFHPEELNTYFKKLQLPTPSVAVVAYAGSGDNHPGTNPLDPANPDVEVMLDIQVAGAVAPGAKFVVYFAPDASDASFLGAMSAIVHDNVNNPSVVSISWGGSEDSATDQFKLEFDQILQSAALMGMTVCAAAGDNGSADFASDDPNWDGGAHVDFPASDPYVLACGGTFLTAADGNITSEVVWNDGPNDGTGGGVSRFFSLPTYQQNANVPAVANPEGAVTRGRGVPDVAGNAAADSGYRILCDGQQFPDTAAGTTPVGGTSAVAPLWAGLIARINQSLGTPVGYVNPLLYNISQNAGAFRDVTQGENGDYAAGPGWDPCTGLGTPDGQHLTETLRGAATTAATDNQQAERKDFTATRSIQPTTSGQPSLPDLTVLAVPANQVVLFRARGRGVQIYRCDPATHTFDPPRPQAILVTDDGDIIHHFKGPTWQAEDGSLVVGTVVQKVSAPADNAIPWLLLTAASHGGTAGGALSKVSFIQRVYTQQGNPPSGGCDAERAGSETRVFYEAEYYFYVPRE